MKCCSGCLGRGCLLCGNTGYLTACGNCNKDCVPQSYVELDFEMAMMRIGPDVCVACGKRVGELAIEQFPELSRRYAGQPYTWELRTPKGVVLAQGSGTLPNNHPCTVVGEEADCSGGFL